MISATPHITTRDKWMAARLQHLQREKEITRLHDQLLEERRKLPWVKIDKNYVFESADGPRTLADLFEGRKQLFLYHFMLGPGETEGCKSCSFFMDHVEGFRLHIENHDLKLVAVSRGEIDAIEAFKRRMGWNFTWVSSAGSDFNFDFHVSFTEDEIARGSGYYNYTEIPVPMSELPGASVFVRGDDGSIYHTYSAYSRGLDILLGAHNVLDFTPAGRNEVTAMDWVRHHDRYGADSGTSSDMSTEMNRSRMNTGEQANASA